MKIKIERGNTSDTKSIFFIYDETLTETIAILDIRSWDAFRQSAEKIKNKTTVEIISNYLLENLRTDYIDLLPYFYIWLLEFGYLKATRIFDNSIFPRIASKMPIENNTRWLIAFDHLLSLENRFLSIRTWFEQEKALTQHQRIEQFVVIHALFAMAKIGDSDLQENIYALYSDFIQKSENADIDRSYGEIIENDVTLLKEKYSRCNAKETDNSNLRFLNNWLMRRYALNKTFKSKFFSILFWVVSTTILLIWIGSLIGGIVLDDNTSLIKEIFKPIAPLIILIPISIFILNWHLGGWRLSNIIWGSAVGWFFIFSAVLVDMIYQKYNFEQPQILEFREFELISIILIFLGLIFLMILREIREARILSVYKRIYRIFLIILSSLPFSFIEGLTIIILIIWLFPQLPILNNSICWFNRWIDIILSIGSVQAMAIGLITQLIWQSRRLTEIVRK